MEITEANGENQIEKQYRQIVDRLESVPQFTAGTGIERARRLLELLGHPEKQFRVIHVAGTNGKGSVCAYLERILRENGYRTGLFVSPHLNDVRERICVNGEKIGRKQLIQAYRRLDAAARKLQESDIQLSYFEYFLGIGLCAFAAAGIDYLVMETGLGGRLDATNAVETPVLCVITAISLEHTALLGDTVAQIAAEKAGIIKKQVPVVYLSENTEAAPVIQKTASAAGAPGIPVCSRMYRIHKNTGKRIDFSLRNGYYKNDCFSVTTGALYQVQNCALALTAAAVLATSGAAALNEAAVRSAVRKTFWPGRMEEVQPHVYVDGAHNPEAIDCLIRTAAAVSGGRSCSLLFSVVRDKNYEEMIQKLCACGVFDRYVVTQIVGERQLSDENIMTVFRKYTGCPVDCFDNVREAYLYALENRPVSGYLFCTGSLYLVGDIKALTAEIKAE